MVGQMPVEGPTSPCYSAELWDAVGVFALHPDWALMVAQLQAESLMARARFDDISNARWDRIQHDKYQRGRWRYWQDPKQLARII